MSETDSREQVKLFHPLNSSLSTHTRLSPGLDGNLQMKRIWQVSSAAPLCTVIARGEALAIG